MFAYKLGRAQTLRTTFAVNGHEFAAAPATAGMCPDGRKACLESLVMTMMRGHWRRFHVHESENTL